MANLSVKPKLILIDEITAVMDPEARQICGEWGDKVFGLALIKKFESGRMKHIRSVYEWHKE